MIFFTSWKLLFLQTVVFEKKKKKITFFGQTHFLTKIDSKKIFNVFLVLIFFKKKFWVKINTKKNVFFTNNSKSFQK